MEDVGSREKLIGLQPVSLITEKLNLPNPLLISPAAWVSRNLLLLAINNNAEEVTHG